MGLFKVFFILVIVWYVMKLIIRYIVPKAILHFIKKRQGFGNNDNSRKQPKEGEIHIKMDRPPKNGKNDKDFGEYVDFEEVKPEQKPEDE